MCGGVDLRAGESYRSFDGLMDRLAYYRQTYSIS